MTSLSAYRRQVYTVSWCPSISDRWITVSGPTPRLAFRNFRREMRARFILGQPTMALSAREHYRWWRLRNLATGARAGA